MAKLNFYTVDFDYVDFLKKAECDKRGFSRVPNMKYSQQHKPKFLLGIVLQVNYPAAFAKYKSFAFAFDSLLRENK